MAFGMKLWGGLTAFGIALVGVFLLPPAAWFTPATGPETLDQQFRTLSSELQLEYAALKRIRWADSLPALAVATAEDGIAIAFPEGSDLEDWILEDFNAGARREIEDLDRRDPRLVFGYFYQPVAHGGIEGMETGRGGNERKETYVGSYEGQPYCLQVRVVDPGIFPGALSRRMKSLRVQQALPAEQRRPSNFLSLCRAYVRHGLAGPEIQSWLDRGAFHFLSDRGAASEPERRSWRGRRSFGRAFRYYQSEDALEPDLCATGDAAACLTAVTDPRLLASTTSRLVAASPMNDPGLAGFVSPFGPVDDYLLFDLEQQFGTDRFEEFWKSDLEVPEAFEAAFGVGMGEWVVEWIQGLVGERPLGPTLPGFDILLSLLMVSAMGWIATAWALRRKVT